MKYIHSLVWIMLSILTLTGCKKDDGSKEPDDDKYYIRFKANGVQKEYDGNIVNNRFSFILLNEYGFYTAILSGVSNISETTKNLLHISVRSNEEINPNVEYNLQTAVPYNGFKFPSIEMVYTDESGVSHSALLLRENYPTIEVKDEAKVKFTSITATECKGTFSAKAINPANKKEMLITDGEFHLLKGGQ